MGSLADTTTEIGLRLEQHATLRRLDLDYLDAPLLGIEARLGEARLALGVGAQLLAAVLRLLALHVAERPKHHRPEAEQEQRLAPGGLHGVG